MKKVLLLAFGLISIKGTSQVFPVGAGNDTVRMQNVEIEKKLNIEDDFIYFNGNSVIGTGGVDGTRRFGFSANVPQPTSYNTLLGDSTGEKLTTGYGNLFVGWAAGRGITSGYVNTAIGVESMFYGKEGFYNTGLGYRALRRDTASNNMVAVGPNALSGHYRGGSGATAIGPQAAMWDTSGNEFTVVGNYNHAQIEGLQDKGPKAIFYTQSLGSHILDTSVGASLYNNFFGYNIQGANPNQTRNAIIIGNNKVARDSVTSIGNAETKYTGIGTDNPHATFEIQGNGIADTLLHIKMANGNTVFGFTKNGLVFPSNFQTPGLNSVLAVSNTASFSGVFNGLEVGQNVGPFLTFRSPKRYIFLTDVNTAQGSFMGSLEIGNSIDDTRVPPNGIFSQGNIVSTGTGSFTKVLSTSPSTGSASDLPVVWNSTDKEFKTLADVYMHPVSSTDAAAPNNSLYYSTDQSKLVYKDSGGTVHSLY